MAVTTTESFVIAPVNATQTVDVSSGGTASFPQDTVFTISDGTNAVVFQVESVTSGTVFVITTLLVLSGAVGNRMEADANCSFASTPLSALPNNATPAGTDLLYVVQDGVSYQAEVAAEIEPAVAAQITAALTGVVETTGNQTIGGTKTFSSPPAMSGAGITPDTVPVAALVPGANGTFAGTVDGEVVWTEASGADAMAELVDVDSADAKLGTACFYSPTLTAPEVLQQLASPIAVPYLGTYSGELPNPTTAGNLLLAIIVGFAGDGGEEPGITNAGFTNIGSIGFGDSQNGIYVATKISTGADQTLTVNQVSDASGRYAATVFYFEISGAGGSPTVAFNAGSATTPDLTVRAGSLAFAAWCLSLGSPAWPHYQDGYAGYWSNGSCQWEAIDTGGVYSNTSTGSEGGGQSGYGTYAMILSIAGSAGGVKFNYLDPQSAGPPTPVQQTVAQATSVESVTATPARAWQPGNTLLAIVGWDATSGGTFTGVASGGGSWTAGPSHANTSHGVSVFYKTAASGDTDVVATQSNTAPIWVIVLEFPSLTFLTIGGSEPVSMSGLGWVSASLVPDSINSAIIGAFRSDGALGGYVLPMRWSDSPIYQSTGCGLIGMRDFGSNESELALGIECTAGSYADSTGRGMVGVFFEVEHA